MRKSINDERGAVLVESVFAIAFWLFMCLAFVNAALLMVTYFSLNQATRDAANQLATVNFPTGTNTITVNLISQPTCNLTETTPAPAVANCKVYNIFYSQIKGKNLFLDKTSATTPLMGTMTLSNTGGARPQQVLDVRIQGRYVGLFTGWTNIPVVAAARVSYIWPPFEGQ